MPALVLLVVLLIVVIASRAILKEVGKRALAKVPEGVRLARVENPSWRNRAQIETQSSPLSFYGFNEVGAYSVSTIPGVLIKILFREESNVAAHIYDHPRAGSWTEIATRYTDGRTITISDLPETGVQAPPWVKTTRVPRGTPTDQMYKQHMTERDPNGIKPLTPEQTVREFEDVYARFMQWKKTTGISPDEVARVAKRNKQAGGR